MNDWPIYLRLILYLVASIFLAFFSTIFKTLTRRLRNISLMMFFVTIAVSLIARLFSGALAQNFVNDWFTTPALVLYVVLLVTDFILVGRNGTRKNGT